MLHSPFVIIFLPGRLLLYELPHVKERRYEERLLHLPFLERKQREPCSDAVRPDGYFPPVPVNVITDFAQQRQHLPWLPFKGKVDSEYLVSQRDCHFGERDGFLLVPVKPVDEQKDGLAFRA